MKLKRITSLFCAGTMLFGFAAAPIGQAQAYTVEVQESRDGEHIMPEVVAERLANPVNHFYDSAVWAETGNFPFDKELIMPGDTFEIHPYTVSGEVESRTWFAGNTSAPYSELFESNITDGFEIEGEVEPVEFETITFRYKDESVTKNFCVKWKNNTNCPLILGSRSGGSGSFISCRHFNWFKPTLYAYSPYYSITYPDYDNYGDYFWVQGDYKTLDFPSYYYLTDIEYSITLPNPRTPGKHFAYWIAENEEIEGDYSNIPVGWDKDRRKSSYNYRTGLVNRTEDVSIAPHFENGYTITFECRGGAIDGFEEYIAEVPLTNDGTFDFADYIPKKAGDTFLGWCTAETAYYDSFLTKDDEQVFYDKYFPKTYIGTSKNVTLYAKWANETDEALEKDGWKLDDDGTLWIVTYQGNQGWVDAKTADETLAPKVKSLETVYKDYSCSSFIDGTFTDCTSLVDLVLPENAYVNGREEFKDCTSLKTITIKGTSFYFQTHHWDSAIYNAPKDLVIKLPDLTEEEAQQKMGGYAYLLDDCKRYDLIVNGELITENNLTVQCGEGTATFDPKTNTLTLENAEIDKRNYYLHYTLYDPSQGSYKNAAIRSALPKLNVVLKGKNNVTLDSVDGIQSYGELSVTGDGSLETYFANSLKKNYDSDMGTYTDRTDNYALGITADGDLALDGISGTRLNVKSKANLNVKNVTLKGGVFSAANDLTVTNSSFAAFTPVKQEGSAESVDHYANLTGANITVDNCEFEKGRITPPENCASITIKDSTLDLDGKITAAETTKLTIENSTFTATGQSDGVTNIPAENITLKDCGITKGDWTKKGEFEILPQTVIDNIVEYKTPDGDLVWSATSGKAVTFTVTREAQKPADIAEAFKGITIDGETIPADNYSIKEISDSSLEVTLKESALKVLSYDDTHTAAVVFDDGQVQCSLFILEETVYSPFTDDDNWYKGSGSDFKAEIFRDPANGSDFADTLKEVVIDDEPIDPKNYTIKSVDEYSVVLVLKASLLETLPKGAHEVYAVFADGEALYKVVVNPAKESGDSDTSNDVKHGNDSDTSSDVKPKPGNDSDTSSDVKPGDDTDTSSDVKPDTESDTSSDVTSDTESDTSSDVTTDTESDTSSDVTSDTESDTSSDVKPDTESDTFSDTDTDSEDSPDVPTFDDEKKDWTPEQTDGLTFTIKKADVNDLTGITLNGETVDPSNYTVTKTEDGIAITLSPEFLQTLAGGSYKLLANFANGSAETQITVESSSPAPIGIYGDLDGDEQITANNALTILRASVGMEKLTPDQRIIADVDNDGDITANDALAVLRNSVGMGDDNLVGKPVN